MQENILNVRNLSKHYADRNKNILKAVDDVTFSIKKGSIFALIGESGCGKTTLAKTILKLTEPTDGEVIFNGIDITKLSEKSLRSLRHKMQIIFQNPYSSLNPRIKVGEIIKEGITENKIVHKKDINEFFENIINECEIDKALLSRYPDKLSGGERQRISIARALALKPQFVIADEIISSLDKEVAKQILDLVLRLKNNYNISFLYISHDISSVKYIADYIAVMQSGKIVEQGERNEIINSPKNEYTKLLLNQYI